ncbi:hypothetical protein ABPG74_001735 [Tetrahymena malaccensis]
MNQIALPKHQGNQLLLHAVAHSNVKDILALLNDNEADANACNINGATALHYAVNINNPVIVEILLKYKADPNRHEHHDVGEKTPLHYAVEKNSYEVCNKLLEYGANPNLKDKRGMTPLHYSAKYGFKQICQLLFTSGADINLRDEHGFNASYYAQQNKHLELLNIIGPPRLINVADLLEFKMQMREIHAINVPIKGKKKKKKKK